MWTCLKKKKREKIVSKVRKLSRLMRVSRDPVSSHCGFVAVDDMTSYGTVDSRVDTPIHVPTSFIYTN